MIDFQAIHARHLQIFREYNEFCRKTALPSRRAQAKMAGIKRVTMQTQQMFEKGNAILPGKLIGQRFNLLA